MAESPKPSCEVDCVARLLGEDGADKRRCLVIVSICGEGMLLSGEMSSAGDSVGKDSFSVSEPDNNDTDSERCLRKFELVFEIREDVAEGAGDRDIRLKFGGEGVESREPDERAASLSST